jgi:4-amino-4-deoxychorismate lyase
MLIDGLATDVIPADDRGLAYGDGLFETIRLHNGCFLFLNEHLERLQQGCNTLNMNCDLLQITQWLLKEAASAPVEAIIKLMLTRGSGGRGYKPPEKVLPRCIITTHPLPQNSGSDPCNGIKAFICKQRLAQQPALAGIKHLNRLEQVLGSMEFPDASYHEGLMADYSGSVIEGTRSNLFVCVNGILQTPALEYCGIQGVLRRKLLEHFGTEVQVTNISLDSLQDADELFFANSVMGIWPITLLQHGKQLLEYELGQYSKSAQDYFIKALQACSRVS